MEFLIAHIAEQLPQSPLEYVFQIMLGLILAVLLGSFVEHVIHKYFMHRKPPLIGKRNFFATLFHSHAVLHHGTFYKRFDHEDDPMGREESIIFDTQEIIAVQLTLLPVFLFIAYFSPIIALCFPAVAFTHNHLWNIIHREMHQPKKPYWAKSSAYRFLARHHFLHHRHTATNYNVVFPLADYILCTTASATTDDIAIMKQLEY